MYKIHKHTYNICTIYIHEMSAYIFTKVELYYIYCILTFF